MRERDVIVTNGGGGGIGWFVAGALVVALGVAAFLYADGYFNDDSVELKIQLPKVEIDGN